jgi:tRNA(fMet)-specific endonuclease VapC
LIQIRFHIFFRGNNQVVDKIDKYLVEFGYINISIVTYYEILNGLLYKDASKQLDRFLEFVEYNKILPLTVLSANKSAKIYAELRKTGKTISHNDVLIAGIAITNDLILVTNNTSHLERIPELEIDNWIV